MDFAFYKSLFRKDSGNTYVDHVLIPSLNLFDSDFVHSDDFELSVPVQQKTGYNFCDYNVFLTGREVDDLSEQLLSDKKAWTNKLKRLQPKDANSLRELKNFRKGKESTLSIKLRRFINHIENDPIAGFEGTRNWLYSGGTIAEHPQPEIGKKTIVAAGGTNLSSISKIIINDDDTCDEFITKLKINSPIVQIMTDPTTSLIGVRQKNNFTVLETTRHDFIPVRKKKLCNTNYFTSAAMSNGKVALAKNYGEAAIFDVETNNVCFRKTLNGPKCSIESNWSQVHWKNNQLLCLDRRKLGIIDPRIEDLDWSLSEIFEDCEFICNYFESDNFSYVSSTHHLYQVDFRNKKLIRRWTHLMRSPPNLGQAIKIGADELIVLQSNLPYDSVVINNSSRAMHVPPLGVPSPIDALRRVQLEGYCLEPEVSKRTKYTITGTYFYQGSNNLKQLTQNAGGDIFIRSIISDDELKLFDDINQYNKINMESWKEFEIMAPIKTESHCSEIVDMTKTFEYLQFQPNKIESDLKGETIWGVEVQIVPERLHKFKDILTEPLLEIWNIVPQESDEEMDENLGAEEDLSSEAKVAEWLLKYGQE